MRLGFAALFLIASSALAQTVAPVPDPSRAKPVRGALTATELAIVNAVPRNNVEGLRLLERLVNINSGTMNFAGVKKVGDMLQVELDKLGFETRWVDGA